MTVSSLNALPLRILKNAFASVLQHPYQWLPDLEKTLCGGNPKRWRWGEKNPNIFKLQNCLGFVIRKFSDVSLTACVFFPLVYVKFIRSPPLYKSGISNHNLPCQLLWVKSIAVTELSCFCLCSNFQTTITIISLKQADPLHFLCSYNPTLS